MKPQKIEISSKTIIFTFIFIVAVLVLWNLRSLIMLLFVCFMFMEVLNPTITQLEKYKIPRAVGILIIYVLIIAIISFSVAGIIPIFVEQSSALIQTLPRTLENFNFYGISATDINNQFKLLEPLPAEIAKTVMSIFSNLLYLIFTLVVTFYLLLERKHFDQYSLKAFGETGRVKTMKIFNLLENRLGNWVVGEMILMTIIGVLSYIAYTIIGLNYAVPLALIAGLLEVVPNIGPTFATVVAAIVGLTISPATALYAILAGTIVQQLENNLIVPKIMKETTGLNPIITIIVMAIGAKLAGVVGVALAVPIFLTLQIITGTLMEKK